MPGGSRSALPLVGTALPVVLPKGGRAVQPPPVGCWVKLRNIGARVVAGQLQVGRLVRRQGWHGVHVCSAAGL